MAENADVKTDSLPYLTHEQRENFIVLEGLDGVGKDTILSAITDEVAREGMRVFDLVSFWKKHNKHPDFEDESKETYVDLSEYDVLLAGEPTYCNIGRDIRFEMIMNPDKYSTFEIAQAYALDRKIHLSRNVVPALKHGLLVIQSRSFISSLVYQTQYAQDLEVEDILSLPGNQYARENSPGYVMLATIQDMQELERRMLSGERTVDGFENIEFQKKLKPHYEGDWLQGFLHGADIKFRFFPVDGNKEEATSNAVAVYRWTRSFSE